MLLLTILIALLPLISAHGSHDDIHTNSKRSRVLPIERRAASEITVPQSLNLTNSSLTYLVPDIQIKAISYLAPYVNFSYTAEQESEALQTYQKLVQALGFVPNAT